MGHPEFAAQIAKEYSPQFGRKIDPAWEVCTSVGATGMISNVLYAFLKPGDEMVCFEPSFLGYAPLFHIVGPTVKWIHFKQNKKEGGYELDKEQFEKSINNRTRIVFINNPHNPYGHIFRREELEFMADVIRRYPNLICVMDEVYEKFCYGGRQYTHMATLPGMWERTISLYSSGKVFSCTGWRVGFAIAPVHLNKLIASWQTWNLYCLNTVSAKAIQLGMEYAVTHPYEGKPNYYEWVRSTFEWRANKIAEICNSSTLNMKVK